VDRVDVQGQAKARSVSQCLAASREASLGSDGGWESLGVTLATAPNRRDPTPGGPCTTLKKPVAAVPDLVARRGLHRSGPLVKHRQTSLTCRAMGKQPAKFETLVRERAASGASRLALRLLLPLSLASLTLSRQRPSSMSPGKE